MFEKRIIVIGGSISGCATALLLQRLGFNVLVLERSNGILNQGSGITLPETLVNQCIDLDLFDQDIPRLPIYERAFLRRETGNIQQATTFWRQQMNVMALNWMSVYQNLRKRILPENYHINTEVRKIDKHGDIYSIETSKNIIFEADIIIAADGVDSNTRNKFLPKILPKYAGYIAWRGVIELTNEYDSNKVDSQIPFYMFSGGHILLYRIPSNDYQQTGRTLLNWVMYEDRQDDSLSELLVDNVGKSHFRSLPAGLLSESHVSYLREFANRVLPSSLAEVINQTKQPFIQAVFDCQITDCNDKSLVFVGDAFFALRPHTGSGVLKALSSSIALFDVINERDTDDLLILLSRWQKNQQIIAKEENSKAIAMGRALVTQPPDWTLMNQELTDEWWSRVMQGRTWYATKRIGTPEFFDRYQSPHPVFKSSNEVDEINYHCGLSKL